jgi:hypothetical protein
LRGCHSPSAVFLFTREAYELEANSSRARGQLVAGQHLLNQRREDGLVHRRELHQACVQTLHLCRRHGVEIYTRWVVLAEPLQPTQEDLRCARVCDRLLAQPAFDLRVRRGLPCTAGCADRELEGVVAKRRSGRYRPGERGWVKIKNRDYWRYEIERESAINMKRVLQFV